MTLERIAELHPVVEKLEELGVTDSMLETYLEKHLTLEGYGINLEKFKIVAEALAKTKDVDADGLAAKLANYSSLDQAISSMKADKEYLQPKVEELKKEKNHLQTQVDERVKKKTYLDDEVKHLEEVKNTLNKAIDALPNLEKHITRMEKEAIKLEARDATLAEDVTGKEKQIAEMNEKLKAAGNLDNELGEKNEHLQKVDNKITAAGERYKMFEAFLGLVGANTVADVEKFLISAGALVNEAKLGNYDPAHLVNLVIGQLTGDALDLIACKTCGAEFTIIRGSKVPTGVLILKWCPECGGPNTTIQKKLLAQTLKDELSPKTQITLIKPGQITPEVKPQEHDYSE